MSASARAVDRLEKALIAWRKREPHDEYNIISLDDTFSVEVPINSEGIVQGLFLQIRDSYTNSIQTVKNAQIETVCVYGDMFEICMFTGATITIGIEE